MAMRLYPEAEFFRELEKHGFIFTGEQTHNTAAFRHDGRIVILRRQREAYPDYILDHLLGYFKGQRADGALFDTTHFRIVPG